MIQQLGNVNKLCNCLLWSKLWKEPLGLAKLQEGWCQQDAPSHPPGQSWLCLQTDWRDLWLLQHTCSWVGVNGTLQGAPIE